MVKVVLICGKQGSGKSALASKLASKLEHAKREKFAGPLYTLGRLVYDYVRVNYGLCMNEQAPAFKRLLQVMGTEWGRQSVDDQIWVKCAKAAVKGVYHPEAVVIFDDCRFENELSAFPGAVTVWLEAPEEDRKARADRWRDDVNHPSETGLDRVDPAGFTFRFVTAGPDAWATEDMALVVASKLRSYEAR